MWTSTIYLEPFLFSYLLLSLQAFSHNGHMKLEVLVCVVIWALKVDRRPNVFWQNLHSKLRSPVWVTKCEARWYLFANTLSQKSHGYTVCSPILWAWIKSLIEDIDDTSDMASISVTLAEAPMIKFFSSSHPADDGGGGPAAPRSETTEIWRKSTLCITF